MPDSQPTGESHTVLTIGLVSDTHVPTGRPSVPDELLGRLAGVDHILHAGDLVVEGVLTSLAAVAPTTAVTGNMDPPELARRLALREILRLGGHVIGLAHGHQRHALQNQYIGRGYDAPEFELFYQAMTAQLPEADIIVFGHFHAPLVREWNGVLFINPGSVAPPHARPTYGMLTIGTRVGASIMSL